MYESTHYCRSCRRDIEDCHCPNTFAWVERVAAKRAREAVDLKLKENSNA